MIQLDDVDLAIGAPCDEIVRTTALLCPCYSCCVVFFFVGSSVGPPSSINLDHLDEDLNVGNRMKLYCSGSNVFLILDSFQRKVLVPISCASVGV